MVPALLKVFSPVRVVVVAPAVSAARNVPPALLLKLVTPPPKASVVAPLVATNPVLLKTSLPALKVVVPVVCQLPEDVLLMITLFVATDMPEKSIVPRSVPALLIVTLPPVPLIARSPFCAATLGELDKIAVPGAVVSVMSPPLALVMSITLVVAPVPNPRIVAAPMAIVLVPLAVVLVALIALLAVLVTSAPILSAKPPVPEETTIPAAPPVPVTVPPGRVVTD